MSWEHDTLALLQGVAATLGHPRVQALHLPPGRPECSGKAAVGESCALALDAAHGAGAVGLSYVLFGDTLPTLRGQAAALAGQDAFALAQGLAASPQLQGGTPRVLGLAAANALTLALLRRAGWAWPAAADGVAGLPIVHGQRVGMVGWFQPLAEPIRAAGASLVVLELRSDLQGTHDGITITDRPEALADCDAVLCTGTVLLNGTLAAVRDAARRATRFALLGPSAGLLPDALFAAGVTDLAGTEVVDAQAHREALAGGQRRPGATRKFALHAAQWPGVRALQADVATSG